MAKFKGAILGCKECGREFKVPPVRRETAKYCSKECADGHRADSRKVEQVEKECLRCGKKFHDHPCHSERRKFCSYECANQSAVREEVRICEYCGDPFSINPSKTDICCSWKCRIARQNTEIWPTRTRMLRQCIQCGKEFWSPPWSIKKYGGKYCSKRCGYDAHTLPPDAFKGNHFYTSTFWKKLRQEVLERDGNHCQNCGFDGNGLHIHHIEIRRNGGMDEKDNLMSLCNPCHRKIHACMS